MSTGNTYITETDIRVAGLGGGLTLVRSWNSQSKLLAGLFGSHWHSNFEERVYVDSDQTISYLRGDDILWSFAFAGQVTDQTGFVSSLYHPLVPANATATLATSMQNGDPTFTLTLENGEQRIFDLTTGNLLAISDRNGNTTQLSYDSSWRLQTVTDPAGRHLYFAYQGAGSLVMSVTSDVGLSLSYAYDSQGRLITVTRPDQTTLSFEYESHSLISAVKDSNGKILESHTYDDQARGLTSSRAGGVDAVTITYPGPGNLMLPPE